MPQLPPQSQSSCYVLSCITVQKVINNLTWWGGGRHVINIQTLGIFKKVNVLVVAEWDKVHANDFVFVLLIVTGK